MFPVDLKQIVLKNYSAHCKTAAGAQKGCFNTGCCSIPGQLDDAMMLCVIPVVLQYYQLKFVQRLCLVSNLMCIPELPSIRRQNLVCVLSCFNLKIELPELPSIDRQNLVCVSICFDRGVYQKIATGAKKECFKTGWLGSKSFQFISAKI